MAEVITGTGEQVDLGTGDTPSAAIPQDQTPVGGKPDAAPSDQTGDTVTLSKKDHQALVAARDRANETGRTTEQELAQLQNDFYRKEALETAIKTYPDVPREVLETALNEQQMETIAKSFQQYAEAAKQTALKNIEVVDTGSLTPEQATEQLDKLKDTGNLAGAIGLKLFGKK